MDNKDVCNLLDEIGDMLDVQGEMPFKVQAYHNAANSIRSLIEDVNHIYHEGRLQEISGIGKGISEKIGELLETGRMTYYEELKESVPPSLLELIQIPGVGPKKAKQVYDELNVTTIEELHDAIQAHRLRDLKGMSARTEENILKGIERLRKYRERILLYEAYPISQRIVTQLEEQPEVKKADTAGSLKRMKETIGDIDLLVASKSPSKVMDYFCSLPEVVRILAKGETKSSVLVKAGLQVDLRVVEPAQYGSALQYFVGSKEHSIHLRDIAKKKDLKINEYGIFDVKTGKRLGGEKEQDIYKKLGMDWIPYVLRENKGEIKAAQNHKLPNLIELKDIKGDLHVHSSWTDGLNRIEDIATVAQSLGYSYVAICDHAEKLKIAGGLRKDQLKKRAAEIGKLNEKLKGFTVLSGIELNIDNEGKVDYDEKTLAEFDVVVASIHSGFGQDKEQITLRTTKAMKSPHVDIIAHPTGRLLGKRDPYQIDLEKVFEIAAETDTFLELNSFPDRLDLKDDHLREAKKQGVKFAISTDAHIAKQMSYIMYGVATAQRGWIGKEDVINTYPLKSLRKLLG